MNKPDQLISRRKLLQLSAGAATAALLPTGQAAGAVSKKTAGLTSENDLTWLPGHQLTELIAQKQISPVEVTKHFLQRIDRLDNLLHAYLTVAHEGALSQARRAEQALMRGEKLGPLHGLPISIKDLYMTKGLRTTKGSQVYKDLIPDHDEILVERLRQAGAIILGKTQTPEFATFPRTKNFTRRRMRQPVGYPTNHRRIQRRFWCSGRSRYFPLFHRQRRRRLDADSSLLQWCLRSAAKRGTYSDANTIHMASAGPMPQYVRDTVMFDSGNVRNGCTRSECD